MIYNELHKVFLIFLDVCYFYIFAFDSLFPSLINVKFLQNSGIKFMAVYYFFLIIIGHFLSIVDQISMANPMIDDKQYFTIGDDAPGFDGNVALTVRDSYASHPGQAPYFQVQSKIDIVCI